jgi:alpha-L-fucosidase 2
LLPALPDAWSDEAVQGLCARGAFVISMDWKNGQLKNVTLMAKKDGSVVLVCNGKERTVQLSASKQVNFDW